uniref:TIGR03663 family protein n=1 Tax=Archaeoglobus fulgidus TaxID=2234 RepID=A0A7J2TLW9_ARCFL
MKAVKRLAIALIAIAIATRLLFLDARPMDHDESVHAWISLKNVVENPSYRYDPAFHGPFVYFVISLSFLAFGDSDFSARLPIALFSVLGVYFALKFSRWYGKSAYLFALFMLISPSVLYYSRYARDDAIVISSFVAFAYFYLLYREERKLRNILFATLFLAIIFTSKENWTQYFAVVFLSVLIERFLRRNFSFDRNLIPSAILFFLFSSFLYSSAFAYLIHGGKWLEAMLSFGWISRFFENLPYWISQGTSSHEKPIYYYFNILLRYEFLPLATAIASIRRKNFKFQEIFAVCWLSIAFLFYHAMVYKTPWLVVHLATPLSFFTMVFMDRDLLEKREVKAALAIGALATAMISIHVVYFDYDNVDQPLIYVQTQKGAVKMAERIKDLLDQNYRVAVFAADGHYWPLPWILRKESAHFTTVCPQGYDYVFAAVRDYHCLQGYEIVGKYELRRYWEFYELRRI